jgi:REP element-mobilizing transposase RayT
MSRPPLFFAEGEWYHSYSRGIDKRTVFEDQNDYNRFSELLYLVNSTETLQRSNLLTYSHKELFTIPRANTLIEIGAWALMPNHFHLFLFEKQEGGISTFMQKLGTAYTMYFNIKYNRSGGLFTKPFRAQHVANDRYFQYCIDYIHLNPLDLFQDLTAPKKKASERAVTRAMNYQFSSFRDFPISERPERSILGKEVFSAYHVKSPQEMGWNALSYAENVKATP